MMGVSFYSGDGARLKPCTKCGTVKALGEYYCGLTGKAAGKYSSACKDCIRRAERDRVRANPARNKEKCAAYYALHTSELLAYGHRYYREHGHVLRARKKARYQAGKAQILARNRRYYAEHQAQILARVKAAYRARKAQATQSIAQDG
jgi:hypothetical protein